MRKNKKEGCCIIAIFFDKRYNKNNQSAKGAVCMNSKDKICQNCKWHDDFSCVCFNGCSDYIADFTDDMHTCEEWEAKEDETTE